MKTVLSVAACALLCSTLLAENRAREVGGDISLLPSYEQYKTPYKDLDGKDIDDVVTYLHDQCGWTSCRVRLFVNPTDTKKEGTVQDVSYVKKLCRRIKEAGMKLMVDFHYSDTWADPAKQTIPASWKDDTSNETLADSVYQYTLRSLMQLKEAGAEADYVQIGNEISYGMLWRNNNDKVFPALSKEQHSLAWSRLCLLLNSGAKAVREACPEAKIVIHTERTKEKEQTVNYYNCIEDVDYDIIGLSYYCFWHGNLSTLSETLEALRQNFGNKEVQIVETAYYNQYYPNSSDYADYTSVWPASESGQQQYIKDLTNELRKHDNVTSLYYWFAEENGNGGPQWNENTIVIKDWVNRGLWHPETHKALKALYELRGLISDDMALEELPAVSPEQIIYRLDGKRMTNVAERLHHGLYIVNGQKVWKR